MMHSLRLTPKVTLTFVIFAFVLLSVVGVLAYTSGRTSLEQATFSGLTSAAVEKEAALETWISQAQNQIQNISESPFIREQVAALTYKTQTTNIESVHDDIVAELTPLIESQDTFIDLFIVEPITGKIIAATNAREEGTFKEDRPYFINGQKGVYVQNVYFSIECQCPAMTASAPIKSDSGALLAVIAGKLNLVDMGIIINRSSGPYQSGDAYLVNTSSLLVTQPRMILDAAVLQRGVHTDAVKQCLLEESGSIQDRDYRDVPAMAVYRWLGDRRLCLVVKVDQAEALEPVRNFGRTLLITAGIALLGASILAVTLAQTITHPVLALKNSVTQFGQGNLDIRFPARSKDELGALAREFNTMADAIVEKEKLLQDYAKNLENRVHERTTRLAFLANASRTISESFSYSDRLTKLAELAVPQIADWSSVDMLDDNGVLQCLAVVHRDPQKASLARKAQQLSSPDMNAPRGAYKVIRTGQADFHPEISEAGLAKSTASPEVISIVRELGLKSSMIVPLIAHGHTLGTLTLNMTDSGRQFDSADLALAEDLARRAALMIDNAKLFRETQKLNSKLEQRVQERTAHLTAVNKELEAFSYSVSHDLRAPLRAVDGFSQALLEDYNDILDAMGKDFLSRIRTESQRMGQLIDDLIGLSRFSRMEMNFVKVDLTKMVQEIVAECQAKEPERQVEVAIQEGVSGCGDERLIHVALQNLINNAWKFTGKTPQARIEFGCTMSNGTPEYYIRDNGAGFDMAYVSKLFGAFQRLHGMNEFTGTGIGLATVQRIMHRHGGFIRAEGKVNAGASFYFTLGENTCV